MISMWSKCGGSHRRSESVPPRFGVWARPREGTRAAPARVRPPSVRALRRVSIIREGLLYRSSQAASRRPPWFVLSRVEQVTGVTRAKLPDDTVALRPGQRNARGSRRYPSRALRRARPTVLRCRLLREARRMETVARRRFLTASGGVLGAMGIGAAGCASSQDGGGADTRSPGDQP